MTGQLIASRYRLERQLASGGMGGVWRAHDELLGRGVAVKLLHASLASDPKAAARFKREALTAAGLSHPHIAEVYDFIEEDGRPGIVMELIEGEDLAQLITREAPLAPVRAIQIGDAILQALEAAHARGVVHRDIKPANVLITRTGDVKVADFGIARAMGESSLTATGTIMGTAHYSAPEQLRGEGSTPRTDLYALGIIMYEMVSGRRPFTGDSPIAVATARLTDDPTPVRTIRPSVPRNLAAVISKAMAREPEERFPSTDAMRAALTDGGSTDVLPVAASDPTIGRGVLNEDDTPTTTPRREGRPTTPVVWKTAAILVTIGGLMAVGFLRNGGPDTVTVPDLTGKSIASARQTAEGLGLTVKTVEGDSAKAKGTVLRQDIAPVTAVRAEGTTITLTISDGTPRCCDVPDVIGMDLQEATKALDEAGLVVGTVVARLRTGESDGTIVDQNPRASIRVSSGAAVDLFVARDEVDTNDDKPGKGDGRGKKDED